MREVEESTAGSLDVPRSRVRDALDEVVRFGLGDGALFAALMAMVLSMRVAFDRGEEWIVRTWWLVGAAGAYGALAWWWTRRPLPPRYGAGAAAAFALSWIGLGAAYLVQHPTAGDGALLLLSLPAFGFLLVELWLFGVIVAFAVVVWASLLSRGVEGAAWETLQVQLFATVLAAGFIQMSRSRALLRQTRLGFRDRARREQLEEEFDSLDRHREELAELSIRDPLTGAFNRRYLLELREQLERPTALWGCVMVDLDDFKRVNDRYGHEEGDRVLQAFAHFLARSGRAEDQLVRYGGDEFLLFVDVKSEQELAGIVARLREAGEIESPAAFSLGCALRRAREPLESVIQRADVDMYAAKGKVETIRGRGAPDRRERG